MNFLEICGIAWIVHITIILVFFSFSMVLALFRSRQTQANNQLIDKMTNQIKNRNKDISVSDTAMEDMLAKREIFNGREKEKQILEDIEKEKSKRKEEFEKSLDNLKENMDRS